MSLTNIINERERVHTRKVSSEDFSELTHYFNVFERHKYSKDSSDLAYKRFMNWSSKLTPFELAEVLATYQIKFEMLKLRGN